MGYVNTSKPLFCLSVPSNLLDTLKVFRHHVRVVVDDYAVTVSALLLTARTQCQHSQALRGHTIFENIKLLFWLVFYGVQREKNNFLCVSGVVDDADTMSA